jgi:ornithine carbamoyltransferase/carbamoyltransferase
MPGPVPGQAGLFTLAELDGPQIQALAARAAQFHDEPGVRAGQLAGRVVGILFTKTSTRTRTAFTVGTVRLGGVPIVYGPGDLQTNTGETLPDTGRVLGAMLDGLVARTAGPTADLRQIAEAGGLPVINAMSTEEHPTQGITDLAVLHREFGSLNGRRVLYVGEGNNTAAALAHGLSALPASRVTFATPPGYGLDPQVLEESAKRAAVNQGTVTQTHDLDDLPDDVEIVYTTRWQTTGTVKATTDWRERFRPFYVDEAFLDRWPQARFMHDLPAHRGEEVSGAVLEGSRSIAWTQARMKLAGAMAVLEHVLAG